MDTYFMASLISLQALCTVAVFINSTERTRGGLREDT